MFNFNKQLQVGKTGEDYFFTCYEKRKPRKTDGKIHDLIIDGDKTVEVKCDTWPEKNFFFEHISNNNTLSLGGIWRSKKDKIDYFVYYFIKTGVFYWFEPKILCKFLNKHIKKLKPYHVQNRGYYSIGYVVPIKDVLHLAIAVDKF